MPDGTSAYAFDKRCNRSPDGEHDIIKGAVADFCRYCWIIPRYHVAIPETQRQTRNIAIKNKGTKRNKKIRLLRLIYARDGRRCWWCGKVLLAIEDIPALDGQRPPGAYPTLDHLQPVSKGGKTVVENLVASCPECNNRRGNAVARYVPVDKSLEIHATTKCPDCEKGVWEAGDGRLCPTCDGAGELSAARAVTLFIAQRQKARNENFAKVKFRAEAREMRTIVENEMGVGSHRRDMADGLRKQRVIIEALSDRILTLKVELAEATGEDLHKLVPHPEQYERALRLVSGN